jgi:hypothetical protein
MRDEESNIYAHSRLERKASQRRQTWRSSSSVGLEKSANNSRKSSSLRVTLDLPVIWPPHDSAQHSSVRPSSHVPPMRRPSPVRLPTVTYVADPQKKAARHQRFDREYERLSVALALPVMRTFLIPKRRIGDSCFVGKCFKSRYGVTFQVCIETNNEPFPNSPVLNLTLSWGSLCVAE